MAEMFRINSWSDWDRLTHTIKSPLLISIGLTGLLTIIATIFYFFAQSVVPIFYSLPLAEQALAPKEWLFLLPVISLIVTLVHSGLISLFNDLDILILRLFAWMTVIMQFFLLLILVRIILITL